MANEVQALRDGRKAVGRLRLDPSDIKMTDKLLRAIGKKTACNNAETVCVLMQVALQRYVLLSTYGGKRIVSTELIDLTLGQSGMTGGYTGREAIPVEGVDLSNASLELRKVERRQLLVNGQPVGAPFE